MSIVISELPKNLPEVDAALFRSRIIHAYEELTKNTDIAIPYVVIGEKETISKITVSAKKIAEETSVNQEDKSEAFVSLAQKPSYSFEQLVLPDEILTEISTAIQVLKIESLVFDTWGLRSIEPNPKTALNFYGPPGTGKTLAAHAIAETLGKNILVASYAEIESKYHGDGPKNVKAIFAAAERENAVLFIDEADSLLSRRLTNVTQGSEQAINSMRSQLLINLELFHGIVIFSTNLVQNYDKAFETRIRHIEFTMPDRDARSAIWKKHLPKSLPLADDVSIDRLADSIDDICGRDIKNAVIQAAVEAALQNKSVNYDMLEKHIIKIKNSRIKTKENVGRPCTEEEKRQLESKVKLAIQKKNLILEEEENG